MGNQGDNHLLLADGHVHLYGCFDLAQLLDAAFSNFADIAAHQGQGTKFSGLLLLTETARDSVFERLATGADSADDPDTSNARWRFARTEERASLIARKRSAQLVLIAGRQIVTREGLEVLALGTDRHFADGEAIRDTVRQVAAADAVPVLPWGVGKWLGRRGRLVAQELTTDEPPRPLVGDNSGRPALWPRPRLFRLAEQRGLRVLPGTDPLPLPGEARRIGSFGFGLSGALSPQRPAADLKRLLADPDREIFTFGTLESVPRFLRNQMQIRLQKWISCS